MPRPRAFSCLLVLLIAGRLLSSVPAVAGAFAQKWALTGWTYVEDVGNTDSDPQHELLFASNADGHLALVDGLTGVIAREFPEFTSGNSFITAQDIDGDGRAELFFARPTSGPVSAFTAAYRWNGSSYGTLFTHTDPVLYSSLAHLRSASSFDELEVSDTDVRVRNLSGTVLFKASTAIPGWTGAGLTFVTLDLDHDGVDELGLTDSSYTSSARTWVFKYSGAFVPAWTATGWQPQGLANTDGDPQPEVIMFGGADGRYALFDGISGVMEKDFPGFTVYNGSQMGFFDTNGDGREEVFLLRPQSLPTTRLFTAYQWNGGTYTPMFSHTDYVQNFNLAHLRSATQYDLLESYSDPGESLAGEVRVRDLAGNVVFRGSTFLPGWSGQNLVVSELDTDHDGIEELAIQDNTTARFVRKSGDSLVQSWSTTMWNLDTEIANVDGAPHSELLVGRSGDHHFALLDPSSGIVGEEFQEFTSDNSYLNPFDIDGDGRLELFFDRFTTTPQLFTGYDWTPSGYVTLFSHNDELEGVGFSHTRTPATFELTELAQNEIRIRDASGSVLFRASTDLPGWTGVNRNVEVLDVDGDGVNEFLAIDNAAVRLVRTTGATSVIDPRGLATFRLLGNAPNPFRSATTIRFSIPSEGPVAIRVFDASGRLVRKLDERMSAGPHEFHWDGRDDQGHALTGGLLFYEVTANSVRRTGRMVSLGR